MKPYTVIFLDGEYWWQDELIEAHTPVHAIMESNVPQWEHYNPWDKNEVEIIKLAMGTEYTTEHHVKFNSEIFVIELKPPFQSLRFGIKYLT